MYKDIKRLLIYLTFSFGLSFLWFAITIPQGKSWNDISYDMQNFISLGMLFPTIAHIFTRILTKEGFSISGQNSIRLGINLSDKKWTCFLLAFFLPWLYIEAGNLIDFLFCNDLFDPQYYITLGMEKRFLFLYPANAIVTGTIVSFAAFGEEWGWRGYMMPKLLKIMERKKVYG